MLFVVYQTVSDCSRHGWISSSLDMLRTASIASRPSNKRLPIDGIAHNKLCLLFDKIVENFPPVLPQHLIVN